MFCSHLSSPIQQAYPPFLSTHTSPLSTLTPLSLPFQIANRRLFSVVREERRLTYDASFNFQTHDSLRGGWYQVSVTSSPSQVHEAVKACKEALASLRGSTGIMGDSLSSAKRTILNRVRGEAQTNKFWVESLSGTQLENIPLKTLRCLTDFEAVLATVTVQDVQQLVDVLDFSPERITSCVGITGGQQLAAAKGG